MIKDQTYQKYSMSTASQVTEITKNIKMPKGSYPKEKRLLRAETFGAREGQTKYTKIKRVLSGFVNGTRVSAIADTGSVRNVISAAYALDMELPINYNSGPFRLGNSKTTKSIGKRRAEQNHDLNLLIVCSLQGL
jgi:hypothetical protein